MDDVRALLERTASIAADYLESLGDRRVFPDVTPEELRAALGGPLPEQPIDPQTVVTDLVEAAEPGVLATGTGRYFGFVIGGALPAALAADWLTSAWDQNAGLYVGGPSASIVEQITRDWILDLLGLPGDGSIGFVTGTQMAHATGLAAARFHVLDAVGWDVERHGLQGAPPVRVLAGAKRHVTIDRALRLLGLGSPIVVEADEEGRMRADALSRALVDGSGPTIVCAQAGEVNTGAFDPLAEIADACRDAHAWLHDEGRRRVRDQVDWVPECSRRARGFAVYAALRSLGRTGVVELVERCCEQARRFAEQIAAVRGVQVLNEVVLNQVLFSFEDDERTDEALADVQAAGEVWLSGTTWNGRKAIRVSVSNWQTGDQETDLVVEAFRRAVEAPLAR